MQLIRGTDELRVFLKRNGNGVGCLADTGFLYAASFMDDRLYEQSLEIFDLLAEHNASIFVNVIARIEFVDLVFRKMLTNAAVEVSRLITKNLNNADLFNFLRNIRDQDVAHRNKKMSYKMSESTLKELRRRLEGAMGGDSWREFCAVHSGDMLVNEWSLLEDELGLNFIEVLDGQTSDLIPKSLYWSDMVKIMGHQGVRGPDAMISNLFLKSTLPLLITTDSDIVRSLSEDDPAHGHKVILYLE